MKKYVIVYLDLWGDEKLFTLYDKVDYEDKLLNISDYGDRVLSNFSYNI